MAVDAEPECVCVRTAAAVVASEAPTAAIVGLRWERPPEPDAVDGAVFSVPADVTELDAEQRERARALHEGGASR